MDPSLPPFKVCPIPVSQFSQTPRSRSHVNRSNAFLPLTNIHKMENPTNIYCSYLLEFRKFRNPDPATVENSGSGI